MKELGAVVLAGGLGTRMRSRVPKVLHPLAGKAMFRYALEAALGAVRDGPVAFVGSPDGALRQAVGDSVAYVVQEVPRGTGDALLQARRALEGRCRWLLVLPGDAPLIAVASLQRLAGARAQDGAVMALLTTHLTNPAGYGRIQRDSQGQVRAIVEERLARGEERSTTEVNSGIYCFDALWLWENLPRLTPNATGEIFLTDIVSLAVREGQRVVALAADSSLEILGVNTREQLAQAEAELRQRKRLQVLQKGITLVDPRTIYIDTEVTIGQDTVILPNTYLWGATSIGARCRLGPNTIVVASQIGDECTVLASMIEGARLEARVDIGPFSHLRPGSHIAEGVHIGNFAEVKKSYLGKGTRMGHFSYAGDATIGANVNIGAGTITCNYDGVAHRETCIGDDAFIGSDTMLVAPVRVGERAVTGAGAIVTRDVPPDTVVYGVPARPRRKRSRPQGG